jgi:hypothetical protein
MRNFCGVFHFFQKIIYISAEVKKGMEEREVKEGKEYSPFLPLLLFLIVN